MQNNFSAGGMNNFNEKHALNFNHNSTVKMEPQGFKMNNNPKSANIKSPKMVSPAKKIKREFSVSTKKDLSNFGTSPKNLGSGPKNLGAGPSNFGTGPNFPNTDYETASNIDGFLTQTPEGASCNVCGKMLSCISSARRHYKTTHEVFNLTPLFQNDLKVTSSQIIVVLQKKITKSATVTF